MSTFNVWSLHSFIHDMPEAQGLDKDAHETEDGRSSICLIVMGLLDELKRRRTREREEREAMLPGAVSVLEGTLLIGQSERQVLLIRPHRKDWRFPYWPEDLHMSPTHARQLAAQLVKAAGYVEDNTPPSEIDL